MSAYSEFTKALASDKQQPDAAFVGLLELTQAVVGAKLFTIMVYDGKLGLAEQNFPTCRITIPCPVRNLPIPPTGPGK